MVKPKPVRRKTFSKAALLASICVVPLALTARGSTGSVKKANDLRVTNQTTSFQVLHAEIVGETVDGSTLRS
jgi:hypothetical protein